MTTSPVLSSLSVLLVSGASRLKWLPLSLLLGSPLYKRAVFDFHIVSGHTPAIVLPDSYNAQTAASNHRQLPPADSSDTQHKTRCTPSTQPHSSSASCWWPKRWHFHSLLPLLRKYNRRLYPCLPFPLHLPVRRRCLAIQSMLF